MIIIEQLALELDLFFDDPHSETTTLSITLPFHQRPFSTPLLPDEGVYWYNGRAAFRAVGLGVAWSATLSGEARFQQARHHFEQLQSHWSHIDPEASGHSPRLFFQYAFSEQDPMSNEWQGFSNTLLRLPRLQLINTKGDQLITLSHPIDGTPPNEILAQWEDDLATLQKLLNGEHQNSAPQTLTPLHSREQHLPALQQAIDTIRQGGIEKVVWGTAQPFQLSQPLPLLPALRGLEQRNRRGVQLFFSERGKKWFAAPPEQLLRKEEQQIETEALAGTLPRGNSSEQEQQLEEHLLNDPKLQHEHQLVSDFIQQQLQHHCTTLEASAPPTIHKLENIQHLLTPIRGQLSPGSNLFELIEALHQSPAICGTPKPTSLKWLQQHHNSHRGYYCGGAGWITPQGDGEIYVLLRCAMVEEDCATLYAGAGIVNGSSAEEEQREIALKIQGMVNTLTDTTA